jgi:putative inorganic carbon (HCO3(-)) transporter
MFTRLIQTLDRLYWLWLLLAAPLLVFPTPIGSLALLVLPYVWLVGWLARREFLPRTPLNLSLLLMAVMVLVSLWATYDLNVSLGKITGIMLGFAAYFAVARAGRTSLGWNLCLGLFLAAGIGVAAFSLVGTRWPTGKIALLDHITALLPTRITGLAGAVDGFQANQVAGVLLWILPLLFYFSIAGISRSFASKPAFPQTRKVQWLLAACSSLLTLFVLLIFLLTQSRTGYLALAFALLLLAGFALSPRSRTHSRIGAGAILLVLTIMVGIAVFVSQGGGASLGRLLFDPAVTGDAVSLNTLENRVEIWSRALYALQDFPITGMGMNTFRYVVHRLYPLFLISPDVDIAHAHNAFLQAGLDLGIPGMIALAAVYIGALRLPLAGAASRTDQAGQEDLSGWEWEYRQPLMLGLAGGLLAHLFYSFMDTVALGSKPGLIFWILLGLLSAWHERFHR